MSDPMGIVRCAAGKPHVDRGASAHWADVLHLQVTRTYPPQSLHGGYRVGGLTPQRANPDPRGDIKR